MGVTDVLSRKTGVIVGDDVTKLFEYAREHQFAIPAIVSPAIMNRLSRSPRCRSPLFAAGILLTF
jgi:fructose-bisphosphate aldolase, class II